MISAGVYVVPVIDPPPETIDQVPPDGFPDKVLVSLSVIEAFDVVLSALEHTVNIAFLISIKQLLLACVNFTKYCLPFKPVLLLIFKSAVFVPVYIPISVRVMPLLSGSPKYH